MKFKIDHPVNNPVIDIYYDEGFAITNYYLRNVALVNTTGNGGNNNLAHISLDNLGGALSVEEDGEQVSLYVRGELEAGALAANFIAIAELLEPGILKRLTAEK